MKDYQFHPTAEKFQKALIKLHSKRKKREHLTRVYDLSKTSREKILQKTDGRCHVCGQELSMGKFEADHVVSHTWGGKNIHENFLPACKTCNNYRWHYLPEELQWILKLGVWARTEIAKQTRIGKEMGDAFIQKEGRRESRRKYPRKK